MYKLSQVKVSANSLYPKFYVNNNGTVIRIDEGEVPATAPFVMEPTSAIPEGETVLLAQGIWGTYFINIPASGGDSGGGDSGGGDSGGGDTGGSGTTNTTPATAYRTSTGSSYDGSFWVNLAIPEPMTEVDTDVYSYGDYAYVYYHKNLSAQPTDIVVEHEGNAITLPSATVYRFEDNNFVSTGTPVTISSSTEPGGGGDVTVNYYTSSPSYNGISRVAEFSSSMSSIDIGGFLG